MRREPVVKLWTLGVLSAIPVLLCAQEPAGQGHETLSDASQNAAPPLTPKQKVTRRIERLVEPVTLLSSAFGSGIEQWRDSPPQWGQGSEGYARRFASAEGFTAAHNAVALGFDLALHTDPRYHRSPQAGFKQRLWNSVSQSFIANKDSGGKMINVPEIAGNFGAGFIANTWNPPGYNSISDALVRGTVSLGYHTAKNVLREFLPDLLHPHSRGSSAGSGP